MGLSLRRRLVLAMVGFGTLPLAVAMLVLAFQVRSTASPGGPRAAFDEIAESGRALVAAVDTTALSGDGVVALRDHTAVIARRTQLARRADMLSRVAAAVLGAVILIGGLVLVLVSLGLVRRWSRFISGPIEELVDWVGRIERREPLPETITGGGISEFDQLRDAIRNMSTALERAQVQELHRERLQAFRETARRVAHEMRGPLSAARLALRQLEGQGDTVAVSVLADETARLEQMATEFSQFGRLPEGPESDIDVSELVNGLVASTLPPDLVYQVSVDPDLRVRGHFEPLRRAIHNLIRNAMDATDNRGIVIAASRENHNVVVRVADYGSGVPPDMRARVFEPYFTTKSGGTGLGLAMVQQIVREHNGVTHIEDGETGGAVFVVSIPEAM